MIEGDIFGHLGLRQPITHEDLVAIHAPQLTLSPGDLDILRPFGKVNGKYGFEYHVRDEIPHSQNFYEGRLLPDQEDPLLIVNIHQGIIIANQHRAETQVFGMSIEPPLPFLTQRLALTCIPGLSPVIKQVDIRRNIVPKEGEVSYAMISLQPNSQQQLIEMFGARVAEARLTLIPSLKELFLTGHTQQDPELLRRTPLSQAELAHLGLFLNPEVGDNQHETTFSLEGEYVKWDVRLGKGFLPGWKKGMFDEQRQSIVGSTINVGAI